MILSVILLAVLQVLRFSCLLFPPLYMFSSCLTFLSYTATPLLQSLVLSHALSFSPFLLSISWPSLMFSLFLSLSHPSYYQARSLLYQFRLLPRIPCSLHDLCKLCGPGMWDSRYIPAVECSGEHPDSQSCPYGGTATPQPSPSPSPSPNPTPLPEGKRGSKTRDIFMFRKQSWVEIGGGRQRC